jgi:L-threonylcarbamoyladenylate synthase
MQRVLVVEPHAPDAGAIGEAVRVLRAGGLVGLPTETVYGLAARALDEKAIARVFAAKGRPEHHPLIAHVVDERQAAALAVSWPAPAAALARAYWPGPLTLVVDRGSHVPAAIAGGGDSIAVRAPSHPIARAVIAALGEPVAAPSANRYQGLSPTLAAHVVKELGHAVDLVLDAGACQAGIESTVVDVRRSPARVLRPGAVSLAALRMIVPGVEAVLERVPGAQPRVSPGMDARHYAPRARLLVADTWEDARRIAYGMASEGARVGMMTREPQDTACEPDTLALVGPGPQKTNLGTVRMRTMPADPAAYARALYQTLHDLDDAGVDVIIVQGVPADEAWWAVADRLARAGHPRRESG